LLLQNCPAPDAESNGFSALSETEVLKIIEKCMRAYNADVTTKCLALNALMKLSVRFSTTSKAHILKTISPFRNSMSLELQQRSVEYCTLLEAQQWDALRGTLLDKMPVLDEAAIRKRRAVFKEADGSPADNGGASGAMGSPLRSAAGDGGGFVKPSAAAPSGGGGTSLLDLDDIFGGGGSPMAPMASSHAQAAPAAQPNLMGDIFGTQSVSSVRQQQQQQQQPAHDPFDINNLTAAMPAAPPMQQQQQMMMNSPPVAPAPAPFIAASPSSTISVTAYDKAGFKVRQH
jgi:hypothetical protein